MNRHFHLASSLFVLSMLCVLLLALSGCGGAQTPPPPSSGAVSDQTPVPAPDSEAEPQTDTLKDVYGEDYVSFITETLLMQMGNRMDKDPALNYFPVEEDKPLSDFVTIDENTKFTRNDEGNPVLSFAAGTVTAEDNGEQTFILPLP